MRKLYGLLFLVFCLVPQAQAVPAFLQHILYFGSDFLQVLKPEWRTGEREEPVYKKGENGEDGYYQLAFRVVEKDGKLVPERITMGDLHGLIYEKSEKKEGSAEEIKASMQKSIDKHEVKNDLGNVRYYIYTYKPFPDDPGRKDEERTIHVKADLKEDLFFLDDHEAPCELDDTEKIEYTGLDEKGRPTIASNQYARKIWEGIRKVSHQDQTQEKIGMMHYLKSAYSTKRNTRLFGCYIFMKPYAVACAVGLTVGAYKLIKKLGLDELVQPNTQGLERDELDGQ